MTPERLKKAHETKAANSAKFAAQIVTVDDNWRIVRADEFNWEIQHRIKGDWKSSGHYGRLTVALNALDGKMLGEEAKGSLNELIAMQKAIVEVIDQAAKSLKWLKLDADDQKVI